MVTQSPIVHDDAGDGGAARLARGVALVVDDEAMSRMLLCRLLEREGFATREAATGREALAIYDAERPDILFMDMVMPDMDGLDATLRIKAMAGNAFVPVIFLTGLRDEASMIRCVRAGGDDVLTKPVSLLVLRARILAMERIRDLHRTIVAKNLALAELLDRHQQERAMADRIFSRAIKSRNLMIPKAHLVLRQTAAFSGDLVLTQGLPDGGVRVLIADFSGQGLIATIGALPIADTFHSMTRKGVRDDLLLAELNRKLHQLLPAERFLAAFLVTLTGDGRQLRWWNGGMPSGWLRHPEGLEELCSHALPLGVLPELPPADIPRERALTGEERLLLLSDGLLNASSTDGTAFRDAGFGALLERWELPQPLFPSLIAALDGHCPAGAPRDDIAVIELPVSAVAEPAALAADPRVPEGEWTWGLELRDGVGLLLSRVQETLQSLGLLDALDRHLPALDAMVELLCAQFCPAASPLPVATDLSGVGAAPPTANRDQDPPSMPVDAVEAGSAACLRAPPGGTCYLQIQYHPLTAGGELQVAVRLGPPPSAPESPTLAVGEAVSAQCLPHQPCLVRGTTSAVASAAADPLQTLRTFCVSAELSPDGLSGAALYRWSSAAVDAPTH